MGAAGAAWNRSLVALRFEQNTSLVRFQNYVNHNGHKGHKGFGYRPIVSIASFWVSAAYAQRKPKSL
jgi:hypothetical protein